MANRQRRAGTSSSSSLSSATRPSTMGPAESTTDPHVMPTVVEDGSGWGDWGGSSHEGSIWEDGEGGLVSPLAVLDFSPAKGLSLTEVAPIPLVGPSVSLPHSLPEFRDIGTGAVRTLEGSPPTVFFDPERPGWLQPRPKQSLPMFVRKATATVPSRLLQPDAVTPEYPEPASKSPRRYGRPRPNEAWYQITAKGPVLLQGQRDCDGPLLSVLTGRSNRSICRERRALHRLNAETRAVPPPPPGDLPPEERVEDEVLAPPGLLVQGESPDSPSP